MPAVGLDLDAAGEDQVEVARALPLRDDRLARRHDALGARREDAHELVAVQRP